MGKQRHNVQWPAVRKSTDPKGQKDKEKNKLSSEYVQKVQVPNHSQKKAREYWGKGSREVDVSLFFYTFVCLNAHTHTHTQIYSDALPEQKDHNYTSLPVFLREQDDLYADCDDVKWVR